MMAKSSPLFSEPSESAEPLAQVAPPASGIRSAYLVPTEMEGGTLYAIPDPMTGVMLPEGGEQVGLNNYWLRRLADGSVKTKDNG